MSDAPRWSPMHRLMPGDRVTITHADHDEGLVPGEHEGDILAFANEAGSYLDVDFGDHGTHTLTEDELRRVA